MQFFSARLLLLFPLCIILSWYVLSREKYPEPEPGKGPIENYSINRLRYRGRIMKEYAIKHGYNTEVCFMADLRMHSGQERFFIYNMRRDSIMASGLVAHGRCKERWLEGRKYDNEPGCGCSSLGKYRIGKSYQGRFGLAYKLHGLEATNSNAYQRYVVLHAHECVPEKAVYPDPICQSDGCPTVAPQLLQQLAAVIDHSERPVLLLSFDE